MTSQKDFQMKLLSRYQPWLLSIFRIVFGLLFLQHGFTKFLHIPATQMSGISVTTLPGFAGLFELVGGVLLVVGFQTRITAFILSGVMAVAYFLVHAPQGFYPIANGGELAVAYCFAFLFLAAAGAGPLSVDAARSRL
jgi:putative oxidoreductase